MATPEKPLARKLRIALLVSAGAFVGLLLFILVIYHRGSPPDWLMYTLLTIFGFACVAGLARFAYVLFAELQAPLSELLITFVFASAVMAILHSTFGNTIFEADRSPLPLIGYMLLITVAALLGSIWGWSAAKRVKETRQLERLKLLAIGWLLVPGAAGAAIFLLITLISLFEGFPPFMKFYYGCGLASILMLPGLYSETQIRARFPRAD